MVFEIIFLLCVYGQCYLIWKVLELETMSENERIRNITNPRIPRNHINIIR